MQASMSGAWSFIDPTGVWISAAGTSAEAVDFSFFNAARWWRIMADLGSEVTAFERTVAVSSNIAG